MKVHLGGHLGFYGPGKRSRLEVHLEKERPLLDVVRELGVPEAEIALAAVNREVVRLAEARVGDADHVDLYPPMDGGTNAGDRPAAALPPTGGRRPRVAPGSRPSGAPGHGRRMPLASPARPG
jgi:sulfur carrier protein ThiS